MKTTKKTTAIIAITSLLVLTSLIVLSRSVLADNYKPEKQDIVFSENYSEEDFDTGFYFSPSEDITEGIISEEDWNTLSMKQIDEKLKAAGIETELVDHRDPLYNLTPAEMDKLTEAQWEEIDKKLIEIYGEDFFYEDFECEDEDCEIEFYKSAGEVSSTNFYSHPTQYSTTDGKNYVEYTGDEEITGVNEYTEKGVNTYYRK